LTGSGLFPSLLGTAFERLASPVRAVHDGSSRHLSGTATVERGHSFVARMLCALASLPRSAQQIPVEVQIKTDGHAERWTRFFAGSRPMQSRLCGSRGLLVERLGPVLFEFRLQEHNGAIAWSLVQLSALGIRLPTLWFTVNANCGARGERYSFTVEAKLRGVGRIIRYAGELDVID
jgi:hypothetical protein